MPAHGEQYGFRSVIALGAEFPGPGNDSLSGFVIQESSIHKKTAYFDKLTQRELFEQYAFFL